jgi:hypothetical protein
VLPDGLGVASVVPPSQSRASKQDTRNDVFSKDDLSDKGRSLSEAEVPLSSFEKKSVAGGRSLSEAEVERWEIMPTFTKNLIPYFDFGFRIWDFGFKGRRILYGPGDFLQGMTFAEYKDSLAAAMKYMETGDDAWLDRLTAILYRRKRPGLNQLRKLPDFDGRIRVPYNPGKVDDDAVKMKRVKPGIKYMTLMYVMGCLWTLKNNESGIEIDGNRLDFSILFKSAVGSRQSAETEEDNGVGMIGVMMALAESGVFGNLKDVANSDVWDVLIRMYQLEVDRREFEKRMEKK